MMNVDELWTLIKNGRSARVDWLDASTPVRLLCELLTAMANTEGGTILLGVVGPQPNILGVHNPEVVVDRVLQAALGIDPPLIIPLPAIIHLSNKAVVAVQIPQGMPGVYAFDGRFLRRSQTENIPLRPQELRRLLIERGDHSFEAEITHGASLDDLDWNKVESYTDRLNGITENDPQKVLLKRGCLTKQDGAVRPTNAGILLFGRDPQRFVRGAEITAVRFGGETMSDSFTREDIVGTLPDQIRRAETFLVDHLRKGVLLGTTMARAEVLEYPLEAARELVVNAVSHRDYSISGDGIRLFIFSNRMEVTSAGGLPGPVTVANIKDERFSRNPAIVQVLSDMGFIERLGYGVDRVFDLMKLQKLRVPEFRETDGGFRVTLYNQPDETGNGAILGPVAALPEKYRHIALNPRQVEALLYLHEDGITRITNSDLQRRCPEVHPETIRRDLSDLVTRKVLRKMGQKRGSYYVLIRD